MKMQEVIGVSGKSAAGMTRRDFVAATTLAVPGAMALASSSYVMAQSSNIAVRKEISSLDPAELQVLKDAVRIMKKRPASDPTSWAANADFHIGFCNTRDVYKQIHFGWWFLPWHRAYVLLTERKLQAAVNEPSLRLPYWDWDANPTLPESYLGDTGGSNPLEEDGNPLADPDRWAVPGDIMPADLRNTTAALRARTFSLFGGDPLVHLVVPSRAGLLETPHNMVHYWAGGKMADFATTAYDPLFFGLHGNIDRLWDVWVRLPSSEGNPTDPAWLEWRFTLTDEKGLPVEIANEDLEDAESLGYRYDNVKPPASVAASLTSVGPEAAGAVTIEAPPDDQPTVLISDPLTKRLTAPAQAPILRALAAENPKVVLLKIEGLEVPRELPTIYRFFLNRPDADAYTEPAPTAGYLGNLVLAPLVGDGRQPVTTSRTMLVEGALQEIAANEENSVTIVPTGIDAPPLGLEAGPGPAIEANFVRLSLSVGE